MASKASETIDFKHVGALALTTRTNNSAAVLQAKQSHSKLEEAIPAAFWAAIPNTKSDHELSFQSSYVQLTTSLSARDETPLHSSQRLSATMSNLLGPRPFSGAKLVSPAGTIRSSVVSLALDAITPQPLIGTVIIKN